MKTFETEKHSIPEGATHYFEETENEKFAWWDENKALLLCPGNSGSWESPYGADDISNPIPIPQTNVETPGEKEVEWVNGDKCTCQGREWQFVSILSEYFHSTAVLFDVDTEELRQVPVASLSKLETEAERAERERDARGKCMWMDFGYSNLKTPTWESLKPDYRKCWIEFAEKINYRKEGDE